MIAEWLGFALVMVIGQFSPGPDMLLLTRTSLAEGLKAGWMMVLGIVTGLTAHATLAIGGVAVVVSRGGGVATTMKCLAAGYLLWLALGLVEPSPDKEAGEVPRSRRGPYLRGLFCNLLNPKAMVFFASVLAPFLAGDHPGWWPYLLWFTVVGEGLFFWLLWVRLLQIRRVRTTYQRMGRTLDLLFASALVVLAVLLLF
jgi:threonine/homoserine/homoserine lactone efflux protein